MNRVFINGIASISAQEDAVVENGNVALYSENNIAALDKNYKSIIAPMMLRRMSKAVKMGLWTSLNALKEAKIEIPQNIIFGTGKGCLQDTEKFLVQMLDSREGLLSPTSFIQSTHNTIGGQIALHLKCNAYNMTYSQNSNSFETAILDAMMKIGSGESENALVGGVEENADIITDFENFDGQLKQEKISNLVLLNSTTSGTIIAESAHAFVFTSKPNKAYAELLDVEIRLNCELENLNSWIFQFLDTYKLTSKDIGFVIMGNNGDARYDNYYKALQDSIFKETPQIAYKHLVGENNSISSYALWLASQIFKLNKISEVFKLNDIDMVNPKYALIYNQYLGKNHSLILLENA
ncbi:beta-ketoacyl synthase chain length factor [Gramella sp. AN32]|uniref:Beta-ketoacyl synthase chain length factor n=1 Tax=Christiangramia antarctica TaxID=2058158 RepID=A0ABW5X2D9_9FLAO|nr:beta-ketoacyl synthase chain length factor [Gramella sp. AN32]MCM4156762.1 3-oxoacyl-ACP synthase [Gramella sp. AN32]